MVTSSTIRTFALTEDEVKNAPEGLKTAAIKAGKGKGVYTYAIGVSPLDCMGCGVCVEACLAGAKDPEHWMHLSGSHMGTLTATPRFS